MVAAQGSSCYWAADKTLHFRRRRHHHLAEAGSSSKWAEPEAEESSRWCRSSAATAEADSWRMTTAEKEAEMKGEEVAEIELGHMGFRIGSTLCIRSGPWRSPSTLVMVKTSLWLRPSSLEAR